jgi:asparagine synthase (glutamine-hydrolysing)
MDSMQFMNTSNLKHFQPGTFMEITGGINYYISNQDTYSNKDLSQYKLVAIPHIEHLYNIYSLLCKAVVKRVENTERPVACLLSGGLDSSLVAAIASRHLSQKGFVLETYSIGLEGSEDLKYAQIVADHIKSKHTQIICTEDDFINSIPEVIKDIESYDTTSVRASVGNWNVGKYIKEHSEARVILNGDGADELMGGYMYFHACPNSSEFNNECRRLLENIHCFDVLRSDKCISSHGLEPRTPFLDLQLVEYYLNIPSNIRDHNMQKKQEKYFIRHVINKFDSELLPREVLYRKKEAFSDGVSGLNRSWYEIIQEKVANEIIDDMLYMYNPPITKEQKYYRTIYEKHYPLCAHLTPYFWMPRYVNATDASARTLSLYNTACE